MAGHEWNDWFEREELIGQISDIRVQNLQVERETVQKRTFTRWINLHLEKCKPPLEVTDLFQDVQDGKILMILLEELSGCKLLHEFRPSSHRIFRLNNIAKVLKFLEERQVKLVSIDAADVADGNSSIVLGLIWNIILFFQIKELTGNIKNRVLSSSSLSSLQNSTDSDTSHPSTPTEEWRLSVSLKGQRRTIKTLLQWVQRRTRKYGVAVQDFGKSWKSGLAFLAIIKAIDPSLVDIKKGLENTAWENLEDAFRIAYYNLGIPRLLEPEDITIAAPDEQSIMTYVSQFLEHFPELEDDEISDVIEKSVSPVKDNSPVNGLHQNGDHPVVRNDWVQPPPKIFISSVRDKHEQMSPPAYETLNDRHNQPWNSEEDSSDSISNHTDPTAYPQLPLELRMGVSCVAQSANSAQPSFVGDTPDSLYEFISEEFDGKIQENKNRSQWNVSQSPVVQKGDLLINGELVETGEDTEEPGRASPLQGHAREDYVFEDLFIDESIFSEISEASFKVKSKLPSEEEDAYKYILDLLEQENAQDMSSELCGEEEKEATVKKAPNTSESALEKSEPHNALEEIARVEHRTNALMVPSKCNNDAPSEENPEAMQKIDSIALESDPASEEPPDKELCPMNGSQAQSVSQSPVSVTPLHLVYYPHYNVAISDITEAFSPPVTEGKEHLHVTSSSLDVVSDVKGHIQPFSEIQGNTSQAVPSATLNQMNGGNQEYLEDSTKVEEHTAILSYSDAQVITETVQGVDQESCFNSSSALTHEEEQAEVLEEGEEEQSVQLNAKSEIKGNLEVVEHLVDGMMPTIEETDLDEECNDIKDGRSDSKSGIPVLTEGLDDDSENTEDTEIIRRNNVHSEDSITESHIYPKLSHRKQFLQTTSNQIKKNGSENDHLISSNISGEYQGQESSAVKAAWSSEDPSNGTTPGIYLLLSLWILVYCIIIIPQLNYD
ncbi:calmin-like [Polyodon spathula]|uniref:calmin-like n=1 Tax=Polyodon spathula TaxID=7913 RepID=UPI001B7E934A|nr:calmin-like [Polyodon spathula]